MLKPSFRTPLRISSILLVLIAVREPVGEGKYQRERTLAGYGELDPLEAGGESFGRDRLRTLVRVKRNREQRKPSTVGPGYLKDLADSFPRTGDGRRLNKREDQLSRLFQISGPAYLNGNVAKPPCESASENRSSSFEGLIRRKRSEKEVRKIREPSLREASPGSRILELRSVKNEKRANEHRDKGRRRKPKGRRGKKRRRKKKKHPKRQSSGDRSKFQKRDEKSVRGKLNPRSIVSRIGPSPNFANAKRDKAESESSGDRLADQLQQLKLRTKRNDRSNDEELKYFEGIHEPDESGQCSGEENSKKAEAYRDSPAIKSAKEAKEFAERLVEKVNQLHNYLTSTNEEMRTDPVEEEPTPNRLSTDDLCGNFSSACAALARSPGLIARCSPTESSSVAAKSSEGKQPVKGNNRPEGKRHADRKRKSTRGGGKVSRKRDTKRRAGESNKWSKWTDWSGCTVTCGRGRQIRWRYCLEDCSTAETEMEEKACRLPACPPGKFLGIF